MRKRNNLSRMRRRTGINFQYSHLDVKYDEKTNLRDSVAGVTKGRVVWSDSMARGKMRELERWFYLRSFRPTLLHLAVRWMRLEFQVNIQPGHFLRERNYSISDFLTNHAPITLIPLVSCGSLYPCANHNLNLNGSDKLWWSLLTNSVAPLSLERKC